jgi:hypothetical protein
MKEEFAKCPAGQSYRWLGLGLARSPPLWLGALAGVALFESIPVTRLPAPALDFDIQVVLGGNQHDRSAAAHALWRQRRTPIRSRRASGGRNGSCWRRSAASRSITRWSAG